MIDEYTNFMYEHVINNNPNIKEKNIESYKALNNYDLLVKFKDGRKIIFDTFDNTYRLIVQNNEELTEERFKHEFGIRLQKLMSRNFITQEELACRIGTTQATISKYINGHCIPSAFVLKKISKVLKCTMNDFFYQDL